MNKLNHQIRSPKVRITEPPLGIMTLGQALSQADEDGVDLIELSVHENTSICVLMEAGKWRYLQDKKAKATKQVILETKQIQIRPTTEKHDLDVKSKQARTFLEDGHKVRLVVRLHGRELAHEDEAQEALTKLIELIGECVVEQRSGLEGKQIIALVGKKK